MGKVKLRTEKLKKEIINIFQKFGLSNKHSLISANALINAELVGAYGHGLSRLKMYCDRISKKLINPKPKIKIKKISQSISHIDADDSIKDGFKLWDDREDGSQEVAESALIPILVKAIQEQQALIESLTARITTLEG